MSYKKYVNNISTAKNIDIDLSLYSDHVKNTINNNVKHGCRLIDIVCKEEIYRSIRGTLSPVSEHLIVAIEKRDSNHFSEILEKVKECFNPNTNYKTLIALLNPSYCLEATEEDKEDCIKMHECNCKSKLYTLIKKIEPALNNSNIRDVTLRPKISLGELDIENAFILINGEEVIEVNIEEPKKSLIKESSYFEISKKLLNYILNEQSKISTFYLEHSTMNEELVESIKKEMIFGIKSFLPTGLVISKSVPERGWKIKVEENNLICIAEDKYVVGSKETVLRSIEKNEKQH